MDILSKYFNSKYLLPVLIFIVILFIYSLWGRVPDVDDAWIGADAYTLATDGYVHTELMRGINQQEELFVVHHKLFNIQGALFIKIFGFSLYTLKAISLIYFILFIILFYNYTVRWKKLFNKNDLLLALILLISFPWIFKYAFIYRPEIMVMTLGFLGYFLLEKYLESPSGNLKYLFLAGITIGLAIATHLNGIIIAGAGLLLLVWNKKILPIPLYVLGIMLSSAIYFYDYTDLSYFELWRHQFFDSPSLDSIDKGSKWLKPLFNLLDEHMRYFHHDKIVGFSVFMLFTIITGFKFLYRTHTNLLRFALLIAFVTGMVAMHKTVKYMLLNVPYFIILITLTIKALKENKINIWPVNSEKRRQIINTTIFVLSLIFIVSSVIINTPVILEKFHPKENQLLTEKYAGDNTKLLNIVAPMTFVFNEIKNYNRIQADLCYIELQKLDNSIYQEGFLTKVNSFDVDIIMISSEFWDKLGITDYSVGDHFEHYSVVDKSDQLLVFKRLH